MKWFRPAALSAIVLSLAPPALAGEVGEAPETEASAEATEGSDLVVPLAPDAPEATVAPVADQPWLPAPGEAAVEAVGLALDRIAALELLLAGVEELDLEGARAELEAARIALRLALVELGRLRQEEDLRAWLIAGGLAAAPPETDVEAAGATPDVPGLSSDRMRAIVTEIEGVSFTEGKMQVLTRQLDAEVLTSEQASLLLQLFSFSRDRVEALVFFHPRMTDPENFDGLLSALKFESDRETVRNQLGLATPASGS